MEFRPNCVKGKDFEVTLNTNIYTADKTIGECRHRAMHYNSMSVACNMLMQRS